MLNLSALKPKSGLNLNALKTSTIPFVKPLNISALKPLRADVPFRELPQVERIEVSRKQEEEAKREAEKAGSFLGLAKGTITDFLEKRKAGELPGPLGWISKAGRFMAGVPSEKKVNRDYQELLSEGVSEREAFESVQEDTKKEVESMKNVGVIPASVDVKLKDGRVVVDVTRPAVDPFGMIGITGDITKTLTRSALSKISKAKTFNEIKAVLDKSVKGLSESVKRTLTKRFVNITDKAQIQKEFSARATQEIASQARRLKVAPAEVEKVVAKRFVPIKGAEGTNLPAVITGKDFTLGPSELITPTKKELLLAQKAEAKAIKLEQKAIKARDRAFESVNKQHGTTERIIETLKKKGLLAEDVDNLILEDGTKLIDTLKVKREKSNVLSAVIRKSEIESIGRNYTAEIPVEKWAVKGRVKEAGEQMLKVAKSIELPSIWFERKGLQQLYDPIIEAGRGAEMLKNSFLKRFKEAGLFKKGGWFTADRFRLSGKEADKIGKYYLTRQGKGYNVSLVDLSTKEKKFVEIFDGIIKETEPRFFEVAKKNGKVPGVVENYAPIMTKKDIKLVEQAGSQEWLFRKHPSFFSLKERVKKVPVSLYETDYRRIAATWIDGVTEFLNFGEVTPKLKYLIESNEFAAVMKLEDLDVMKNWLKNITTADLPTSVIGQAGNYLSKLLRKGVAVGSLGLNYASVVKQALTQIPIMVIAKARPKFSSKYAKAFGISVADLPSITKRKGDIAISDLQGKIGRIFTGALTKFDQLNAQASLNGLLDKEFGKFLKEGAEITPEVRTLIEKRAQDAIDMWYGGFFKGQRPEAFRKEIGNFILMFLYPLTSQLNGFYRHILKAGGAKKVIAGAEVLAAATAIAYMEQAIENLSPQWSDKVGMTKDIIVSLTGNIPLLSQITWAVASDQDIQISPVVGGINNIVRKINGYRDGSKNIFDVGFSIGEVSGLPKQVRRIKEGIQIIEEGGITDKEGKMLAPVSEASEYIRAVLRGKYGSLAAQDWIRNIGEKKENRRWFVPQVEFLQNGDYNRKAELYKSFTKEEQETLRGYLSEGQQKKLDNALGEVKKGSLEDIFGDKVVGQKSLETIFSK